MKIYDSFWIKCSLILWDHCILKHFHNIPNLSQCNFIWLIQTTFAFRFIISSMFSISTFFPLVLHTQIEPSLEEKKIEMPASSILLPISLTLWLSYLCTWKFSLIRISTIFRWLDWKLLVDFSYKSTTHMLPLHLNTDSSLSYIPPYLAVWLLCTQLGTLKKAIGLFPSRTKTNELAT